MNSGTKVVQVTNVSPSTTSEQMRTLFGFLGHVEELRLFPPDDSPLPVTSRVCFVKFQEAESVGVAQHLTNTVFGDRALIVVPFAEGIIPDESKALSLLAPANAVAGLLPGGGLLPTPNPLATIGGVPLATLGAPALDPALAALGLPGSNMNSPSLAADQFLKFMTSVDSKLNNVAAGMNINPGLKTDTSSKEIEEAMKRVREAQSLISAAIEPGNKKDSKRKHSRSRSRSRRRRSSRSHSRHRRSKSRSRRRSRSRSRRRSKSPRKRRTHSKERSKRSRSRSRDRKKEEKKRSKTPPKSYSSTRRSRSVNRRQKRSRSTSRSSKKSKSPKRKPSRSPSLRRHKKEKKKDREKERDKERERKEEKQRSRDEREHSSNKRRRRSKDKERDREKSDTEKGDVKVTRDYDEEEQGYDSEKDKEEKRGSPPSPDGIKPPVKKAAGDPEKEPKVNGDDRHEEDMDTSD